ncbi:MAG: hypothetical protein HRT61_15885 [Ekhidna sp.]|nr:hypothetical protein [Ekhidna sp.]
MFTQFTHSLRKVSILLFVFPITIFAQKTAKDVLANAVSYHDPNQAWISLDVTMTFRETRPSGPDRSAIVKLDNGKSLMNINRNDENVYEIQGASAAVLKGNDDEERALMLRNYYLYLWGLPMKLYDSSTPEITIGEQEKVGEVVCDVLRVPYEKDVWYFYFDESSGKMLQYKFYKDEVAGKGELITLEDEIEIKEIRFPQKRSWYTLPEMKYLGTDILAEIAY